MSGWSSSIGNSDLLITFSTPTLQAAVRRPSVVLTRSPTHRAAGAGGDTAHLPNDGVFIAPSHDDAAIKYCRRLRAGTVVPAEVAVGNSA